MLNFLVFLTGAFISLVITTDFVTIRVAEVTEQECNIDKPAGTICKWEATWKPISVDKGE